MRTTHVCFTRRRSVQSGFGMDKTCVCMFSTAQQSDERRTLAPTIAPTSHVEVEGQQHGMIKLAPTAASKTLDQIFILLMFECVYTSVICMTQDPGMWGQIYSYRQHVQQRTHHNNIDDAGRRNRVQREHENVQAHRFLTQLDKKQRHRVQCNAGHILVHTHDRGSL